MPTLGEFLEPLLYEGRLILKQPPEPNSEEDRPAQALLERAYEDYRLEIAGPRLPFDSAAGLAAATLMHWAGWLLVSRRESEAELEKNLRMPDSPQSPAQHLSADVTLRYLPQLHRRARALNPDDILPVLLAGVLRQWPLSGVLADVAEAPTTPLDFGGHPGLLLLYAERLAANEKAAWVPHGPGRGYVELVWAELNKDTDYLYQAAAVADQGEEDVRD
jgi:hypothetical protein